MDHVSHSMEFPVPAVHMGMVPNMPNLHEPQHFSVSIDQMNLVEPLPYGSEFNTVVANNSYGHDQSTAGSMGSSSIWMSNQPVVDDETLLNSIEGHAKLLPAKRKTEMEHALNSAVSQQVQLPSKCPANLGADDVSLGYVQSSESQRKTGSVQNNPGSPGSQTHSALSKRKMRSESTGKSGLQRGRPAKKQTTQVAIKSQPESSYTVRSKMRESLAAALALALQKSGDVSTAKKDESEHSITHQMHVGRQPSESISSVGGNVPHSVNEGVAPSQGSAVVTTTSDSQALSSEIHPNRSNFSSGQTFQDFQFNSILPEGDIQFSDNLFVKDDLLQGNGLSWEYNVNAQMGEGKEAQNADKPPSATEEANLHCRGDDIANLTPENLAFEIEAELFKLFGGTNKKYKEKGRSLLFNLKDQKNPELRESVMSGEISPERLCSMSAEELASKELSEWRIAKAEEMAQMVVLPDTEVDMRRLVRKTHKGEIQVDFEHYGGISDEVSSGSSMHGQPLFKKEIGNQSPPQPSHKDEENAASQEKASANQEFSDSLLILTDGTDLMQGMMVDEFKDAAALPPIVSLDEFMESLNSEPPFENLSEDAVHKIPLAHEVSPKVGSNAQASGRAPISPKDAPSRKADNVKKYEADMTMKLSGPGQKVLPGSVLEVESTWEGILQLSISSFVTVRGLFQSGEKAPTKQWSTSVEIKGRVRLDAFEKFLQQLPMSRTRALMILQFVLKDKSSESQLSTLSEAVDSYTSDERLGFAEPAPGVELYICPPTPRMAELLNKHMPKESGQSDSSLGNGLIGVVVWRRVHISPNASSNHKHSLKKQPFSPTSNRLQDSSNVNVNSPTTRASASVFNHISSRSKPVPAPEPEPEEDDDIPPGFGSVAAARAANDEDDLPEFSFSGSFNSSATRKSSQELRCDVKMTPTPVDHVRELIKKYGQSDENRAPSVGPWGDDDDDIPEWRPEAPYPVAHGLRLHPANHSTAPQVNQQLPGGLTQPAPGGRWPQLQLQPHQHMHGARWR